MSAEQTFSGDLRKSAQDYKRDAAKKHKWALGSIETKGRGVGHPRPCRASDGGYNTHRRWEKSTAVASLAHGTRVANKHDMLEGTAISDESGSNSDEIDDKPSPAAEDTGAYSFDAARVPTQGSQILNVALARAVEKFEEKETVRLVKNEYELLDSDGDAIILSSGKKRKSKARAAKSTVLVQDADEDYEFV